MHPCRIGSGTWATSGEFGWMRIVRPTCFRGRVEKCERGSGVAAISLSVSDFDVVTRSIPFGTAPHVLVSKVITRTFLNLNRNVQVARTIQCTQHEKGRLRRCTSSASNVAIGRGGVVSRMSCASTPWRDGKPVAQTLARRGTLARTFRCVQERGWRCKGLGCICLDERNGA